MVCWVQLMVQEDYSVLPDSEYCLLVPEQLQNPQFVH
jgi:hypothetical protein